MATPQVSNPDSPLAVVLSAAGTPGTPAGGVQTVQGATGGTPLPVAWPTVPGTVIEGQTTVTTAGTRVQCAANALTVGVAIRAAPGNTGIMYVGNASVASTTGYALSNVDGVFLICNNTNLIWVDSTVNGEKVHFVGS